MKRSVVVEIESCSNCPIMETNDGFASHTFFCPCLNKESSRIDDSYDYDMYVKKELQAWFNECTKWKPV